MIHWLLLAVPFAASGGPFQLEAQALPGGAQRAVAGNYVLVATLGDAGSAAAAAGGPYLLQGGPPGPDSFAPGEDLRVFDDGFES